MSTKTTFKRVALVAVAALGLGVLSVAPSSAAVIGLTATATNGTATTAASDSSTAATLQVRFFAQTEATDTVTVVFAQNSIPTGAVMSHVKMVALDSTTATSATTASGLTVDGTDSATATTATTLEAGTNNTYGAVNFGLFMDGVAGIKAGTYTFTAIVTPFSGGAAGTALTYPISIVVTAAAADSKVANAANSSATMSAGTEYASQERVDSAVAGLATASATEVATIRVILRNASNNTNARESVTATITGPGVIGNGSTFGKSVTLAYTSSNLDLDVRPDGTAGKASIAISTPSVTFAAKTVTFYAASAKTITAVANKPVIAASATTSVIYAKAVDANGSAWGGTAYIWAASAADALIAGSETASSCTYSAADDVHVCSVTGKLAGTANFIVADSDSKTATTTVKSNSVAVKVSTGTPTTVKLAFDKATYAPGEKAQIWVTALDSAGNAVPEQTVTNIFAAGGITPSTAFSASSDTLTATFADIAGATSASAGTVAGYKVYTVYMPMSSGTVTISATGGTGLAIAGRVAVSASAEVVNSSVDAATDAANEATDAANAATDAALAAADAADAATAAAQDASDAVAALSSSVSKLISSLRAQITSLTNLVIKIQKKVKA